MIQQQIDATEAAFATLHSCMNQLTGSPAHAVERAHAPPGGKYSLEPISDPSYATDEEIKALYAARPHILTCRYAFLNQLSNVGPGYVPIFTREWYQNDASFVRLIQKKATWGEYLIEGRGLANDANAKEHAEYQRIVAGVQTSQQAEIARRQAAAAAIAQYSQEEQDIDAANQQLATDCRALANSATCVEH
ncbi:MAG TPA: hypothetical protein VNX02_08390 [Steroidobacteraceae bacterium]|nr:hypothetical protein [Steroidobacteraceae bacterium]